MEKTASERDLTNDDAVAIYLLECHKELEESRNEHEG